jgi:nitroreductase
MDVHEAIQRRRAFRALEPVEITTDLVHDLATCSSLAPSCFNKQPWRYVFVFGEKRLAELHDALSKGNEWCRDASLIIAVYSRHDYDCEITGREYYLFDTGLSVGLMILRATELGLVAHPIAGFDEEAVKSVLAIPEEMKVITLIMVGRHSASPTPHLSPKQIEAEERRPQRIPVDEFVRIVT